MTQHHEETVREERRTEVGTEAAEHILGPNPVVGVRGKDDFILSNSGHVQSILNPPGNPKATFFTNAEQPASAEAWYEGASRHTGSWWDHWKKWILAHAGSQQVAPTSLGNSTYRPQVAAPGTYVYE